MRFTLQGTLHLCPGRNQYDYLQAYLGRTTAMLCRAA